MNSITDFPKPRDLIAEMAGPQERENTCAVILDGRHIPNMKMRDQGDVIEFVLDDRLAFQIPREVAYTAAQFAACAMAIGAGYPHFSATHSSQRPFATQVAALPVS